MRRAVLIALTAPDEMILRPGYVQRNLVTRDSLWSVHPIFGRPGYGLLELVDSVFRRLAREPLSAEAAVDDRTGSRIVMGEFDFQLLLAAAVGYLHRARAAGGLASSLINLLDGDTSSFVRWSHVYRLLVADAL